MPGNMMNAKAPALKSDEAVHKQIAAKALEMVAGYYGSDSKSTNVKEFCDWFSKNSDQLLRGFYEAMKNGKIDADFPKNPILQDGSLDTKFLAVFGCYSGMNFLAEKLELGQGLNFPKITDKTQYPIAFYSFINHQIEINLGPSSALFKDIKDVRARFIDAINLGIHEGAHGMAMMNGRRAELTEISTLKAQNELALPLRISDLNGMGLLSGTRDFTHFVDEYNSASDPKAKDALQRAMMGDYFSGTISPWIKEYTKGKGAFGFEYSGNEDHISKVNLLKVWAAFLQALPQDEKTGKDGEPSVEKVMQAFKKIEGVDAIYARFIKEEGIGEKSDLAVKLRRVFNAVSKAYSEHPEIDTKQKSGFDFFLNEFTKAMTSEFGEPKKMDVPKDYVFRQNGSDKGKNNFWTG